MDNEQRLLLEYLYGEMNEADKKSVEEMLGQNPEARAELQELQDIQKHLQSVPSESVQAPLFIPSVQSNQVPHPTNRYWGIAAAAFLLGMLAISKPYVQITRDQVALGFGTAPTLRSEVVAPTAAFSPEAFMAAQSQQQDSLWYVLAGLEDRMRKEMTLLRKSLPKQEQGLRLTEAQLTALRNDLVQENFVLMSRLLAESQRKQELYTEDLMVNFSEFLKRQRTEDLRTMAGALEEVLAHNDRQQERTEYVLSQIASQLLYAP